MQLIDCFSDIFTYTLQFLSRQEPAGEGFAAGASLLPGYIRPAAGQNPLRSGNPPSQPESPDYQTARSAEAFNASGVFTPHTTSAEGKLTDLLTPPPLKPLGKAGTPVPEQRTTGGFTFEGVCDSYKRLLGFSRELCLRGNYAREDYELAKFAVCAWVDEKISSSSWPEKVKWPKAELQRQYFNTTNAGEEFYDKLCALCPAQVEVMEVFANCLALGFRGSYYQINTQEELAGIRLASCRAVLGYSPEQPAAGNRQIFTGAYPTGQAGSFGGGAAGGWGAGGPYAAWGKAATGICCVLVPLAVFVVMYLVYNGLLERLLEGFNGSL